MSVKVSLLISIDKWIIVLSLTTGLKVQAFGNIALAIIVFKHLLYPLLK